MGRAVNYLEIYRAASGAEESAQHAVGQSHRQVASSQKNGRFHCCGVSPTECPGLYAMSQSVALIRSLGTRATSTTRSLTAGATRVDRSRVPSKRETS